MKWPTTNHLPQTSVLPLTSGVSNTIHPAAVPKTIKVGNYTIDEPLLDDLLSLMSALMDLPDDNELKRLFVKHKVSKRITR